MTVCLPTLEDPVRRSAQTRPRVHGKFLCVGDTKLELRGVTYGTFRPGLGGIQFPDPHTAAIDLGAMAAANINSLRTYVPPPGWLLDFAWAHDIRILAGLPWEQHVAFLESRSTARSIEARVREQAAAIAGHPALLGYAVGNEIPAPIARWHGSHRVGGFIERLYTTVKEVDPEGLVTYVNYPTTEYLDLPFLDFSAFNVYLEQREKLAAYLSRLHRLVGDRPLVMAELGLDSRRNGEQTQASTLGWQLDTSFEAGCAGSFVFAWTDEWHRGGHDVEDWDFGLVDRQRRPKPALAAVEHAYRLPAHRRPERNWPSISVVVCSYNGERWLPGCFEALAQVDYPNWEVIVVSDGSTDATDALACQSGHRLVRASANGGLAAARNIGMEVASGEIIAYLDDDARPDVHWLRYLALAFSRDDYAAVGGPNLPPPGDGWVADCVAGAPGGPIHVLVGDDVAEHIPGCNLAVRRDVLRSIDGFDPRYRIAGDDVDLCWRLQRAGHTIGFHPSACVWHHRRPSVRTYLRQQRLYGFAEGLLHQKWPQRYNRLGHLTWSTGIYGSTPVFRRGRRTRISYGSWGSHLFQSVYTHNGKGVLGWLTVLPEWYLIVTALFAAAALGLTWTPLLAALPLAVAGAAAVLMGALSATNATCSHWSDRRRRELRALTFVLHVLQPAARLAGRLQAGLSPWRRGCRPWPAVPVARRPTVWSESWRPIDAWLRQVEDLLLGRCVRITRGSEYDRWDLEVRGGPLGIVRLYCTVEEHGNGNQLLRYRLRPRASRGGTLFAALLAALSVAAVGDAAWVPAGVLALVAVTVIATMIYDCAAATGSALGAIARQREAALRKPPPPAPEPRRTGRFTRPSVLAEMQARNGTLNRGEAAVVKVEASSSDFVG